MGQVLGQQVAGDPDSLVRALAARGYGPTSTPDGIRLHNCPFHHLMADHLDLVCTLNSDLLRAAAEGTGLTAELDPQPGMCCVVLRLSR